MRKPPSKCPICAAPARHTEQTVGDFTEIECKVCGQFRISSTMMATIGEQDLPSRRAALGRAILRAPYGRAPLMTTYDL